MKSKLVRAVDLFCGAGGTSRGLLLAANELGLELDLLAINHWNIAIDTHSANHPDARHLSESLDSVDPRKVVPSGRLKIMCAGPECTHHSNARGGKPMSDQSRASAWHVVRWAEALYIENILIENVREFRNWGPLGANGRPLKRLRGETYHAFLNALRSLGYVVEDRILNAANYGDPTTRERLFILARRGGRKIVWPEPTHLQKSEETLFGKLPSWRPAREIIDWNLKGESIFRRKKPLSPNTMKRIMAGLRKFGGKAFVLGQQSQARPRDVDQPIPTVAGAGAISFVEPFILPPEGYYRGNAPRSVDNPIPTITQRGGGALVETFLVMLNGTSPEAIRNSNRSVDEPFPTVVAQGNHIGVAQPFIVQMDMGGRLQNIEEPLNTLTSADARALVEPFIILVNHGNDQRAHSIDEPMRTITSVDAWALIEPYLIKYYGGENGAQSLDEPLDTIVGRDRFGIVIPELDGAILDIRFRMLQPHELAAAMSFPDDYHFAGNREQKVKQIGNAVAVNTARALCKALLEN